MDSLMDNANNISIYRVATIARKFPPKISVNK